MAYQRETFYRCPNCQNAYFEEKHQYALQKDPYMLSEAEFETTLPRYIRTKYIYICSNCGAVLDRAALTAIEEKNEELAKPTVNKTPPSKSFSEFKEFDNMIKGNADVPEEL